MTLIGLISDVHAAPEPVAEAFSIFSKAGVDQVLCAGDIAGYMDALEPTINLLADNGCKTIVGNHDLQYIARHAADNDVDQGSMTFLRELPASYQAVYEGKSVYMVHAQPPDGTHGGIKLLDKNGELIAENVNHWTEKLQEYDFDVLVVGHTHQVFAERLGQMLVVNPGSTVFNHCCVILRLPELTVELIPLSGKKIQRTWNWGEHVIYGK
jgi:putative phosphoesterase